MRHLLERTVLTWTLLGGAVLLLIVLLTVLNVAGFSANEVAQRFGGAVSALPGYEELVTLWISCAALMFFPYCQWRRGHVAVDIVTDRLPRWARRLSDGLSLLGMGILALFLAYWMLIGMLEVRADGVISSILGWPQWPFYLPGIASLLLWAAMVGLHLHDFRHRRWPP